MFQRHQIISQGGRCHGPGFGPCPRPTPRLRACRPTHFPLSASGLGTHCSLQFGGLLGDYILQCNAVHWALRSRASQTEDLASLQVSQHYATRANCWGATRRDVLRIPPAGGRVDEAPLLRVVCPHFGQQEDSWNGYFSVRILMLSSEF